MRIVLSNASGVPMYEQIKTQVVAAIHTGDLVAGQLLPSLRGLSAELRVSLITVTRAYNDLVAHGLVDNEHGRGFVVRPIDPDRARAANDAALAEAVLRVVGAARAAGLDLRQLHDAITEQW